MATQTELQALAQELVQSGGLVEAVLNEIESRSHSIDELPVVNNINEVTSLPGKKGNDMVLVPIEELKKPAIAAATTAQTAAGTANQAAQSANAAAQTANNAAQTAQTAAETANQAAQNANNAAQTITQAQGKINLALYGSSARFDEFIDDAVILDKGITTGDIVYVIAKQTFACRSSAGEYLNWWNDVDAYIDSESSNIHKDKIYLCGASLYVWSDEENNLVEVSGSGSGSGFYNVTNEQPLESGFYTKETAVAALANAKVKDENKPGMIMSFEVSAGKWVDYRFTATDIANFLTPASWEEYGSGKIKSISLNGQSIIPDVNGNVAITFDQISVDESLDEESSNPVQNAAVTAKMRELESSAVAGVEVVEEDDKNILTIYGKEGNVIASTEFTGGGGGGGGSTASRIIITAALDKSQVKEGGNAELTYSYNHVNADGESDGIKADITVTIKRGTTQTFEQTYNNVSAGTYTLDISDYLLAGTIDVYVKAVAVTAEGNQQIKQAYTSISVVTLLLTSSYNLGSTIADGGYKNTDTIEIPFTITGSGTKDVSMYIDGSSTPMTQTINKSGTVNGSFTIQASTLTAGRHTIQLVAERNGLLSDSIYIDILRAGLSTPFIGIKYTDKSGTIFYANHLTPTLNIGQYEQLEFDYIAYDPTATPATVAEKHNGNAVRTLSVPRSMQTYTNRFTTQGTIQVQFVCRTTTYNFNVEVSESDIAVGEATQGLLWKLSANGRSNTEENPAEWISGGVSTTFENVDWNASGWIDNALKLINGAKAIINTQLFDNDVSSSGATIEMEIRLSNIIDRDASIISCMDNNKGFLITSEEASMYTGSTKVIQTDEGQIETPVGVSMKFAPDEWIKIAFMIGKRSDGRLMELYFNGVRSKADIYGTGDYFNQDNPQNILITSDSADVEITNIRVYNRAISDDEEFSNYAVDRDTIEEMSELIMNNDVLDDMDNVDIDKLINKGKGVILFVRKNGLDEINATNNKDQDFLCDHVIIYTPWGDVVDINNCNVRIQGTSSTKYPRKNYRIYTNKGSNPEVYINGVLQDSTKLSLIPGDIAVNRFNPKKDFSDSTMAHNTGGAKLFNDIFKELGLLTPPQMIDGNIRSTINGYPVDVFSAETIDGERQYFGQYNLNNDKSDWADLTGMTPVKDSDGVTHEWECPICLEFLNNSFALGKFQVHGKTDEEVEAEFEAGFDDALEFNYPKDVYWSAEKAEKKGGRIPTDKEKTAIKRTWCWVRDCVPAGADMTCKDLNTWKSTKFVNEINQYFDKDYILTYYLCTDYDGRVDQRVKNMMARTWDGLKWYLTYYDGDSAMGDRNDSFLKYLYTMSRDTYDYEKGGYAFEGYDSWLWCLVLANLQDDLKRCAKNLREKMTTERVLNMMNVEQSGNWCERLFNKSGEFTYIDPQIKGVEVNGQTVTYPYIYALKGNRKFDGTHFIKNRYSLLDAKYETGNYTSDNIDMYMSRQSTDVQTRMVVTASEIYYFGYGTNNSPSIQASQMAEEDETVELLFNNAFSLNDPVRIYGASRIRKLKTDSAGEQLVSNINLNKCVQMRELDMSTTGDGSDVYVSLDACRQLQVVNFSGQRLIRTGSQASTELNMGNQTKLKTFNANNTTVKSVVFAHGAPLESVKLPSTLTSLRLEYLPKLTMNNLVVQGYSNIETFVFSSCPNLDWETLLSRCANVKRIRVTGIYMEGDGTLLEQYLSKGGIDGNGNATDTCALVGTYRLTQYIDEDVYNSYVEHYPELNIKLPQYTMIEYDNTVSDDANVSNLDNKTGYKYGNDYVPSGHINAILKQRFRCNAKVTTKPSSKNVVFAGVETTVNNNDGIVTIYPLHDDNSNYYAESANLSNCSPAKLDGTEGDVMMFEPHYWFKGINDYLNGKQYTCYSSNVEKPDMPDVDVVTMEDIQSSGNYKNGYKLMSDKVTLSNSYSSDSNYAVCQVDVSQHQKVRFPTVLGTTLICSLFSDEEGAIVETVVVPSLSANFENGMYVIRDVPAGAKYLNFTIHKNAEPDVVVLSNSSRIEDMEPEWVEHKECLTAVFGSSVVGTKLCSCITGGTTVAGMPWTDFHYYSVQRGMQQIDYEMHRDIANLFFAKYGRRNSQAQCGAGLHSITRTTGTTAILGMHDTVNTDGITIGGIAENGLAFYKTVNADGSVTFTRINSTNCLGYENIYGHKFDMMDGIEVNKDAFNGKWVITTNDGVERLVKGSTSSSYYIKGIVHGKCCDVIPAGSAAGSSSTYYCDYYYYTGSKSRVVYRGSYSAYADGGVSNANANYDASYSNTIIGSRLAFRGKIVKATSVAAYKAATAIA